MNKKREALLNSFIKNSLTAADSKQGFSMVIMLLIEVSVIEKIFGVKDLKKEEQQIILPEDPLYFVKVQSYPSAIEEDILLFL